MCGRYSFFTLQELIEKRFHARANAPLPKTYNAAPDQRLPIITNDEPQTIQLGVWGLRPSWMKDKTSGFINARAESIEDKPSFSHGFKSQRCLVLADSFFEWHKSKMGSEPYAIMPRVHEPFAMAGLWEMHKSSDGLLPSFAIITVPANNVVGAIHNRMPLILPQSAESIWIDVHAKREELIPLMKSFPDALLESYAVTRAVNSPQNNSPKLLEPLKRLI